MPRFLGSRVESAYTKKSIIIRLAIIIAIVATFFVVFNPFGGKEGRITSMEERLAEKIKNAPVVKSSEPGLMERSAKAFGTNVIVRIISADSDLVQAVTRDIFNEIKRIGEMLDGSDGNSWTYKVNASAGDDGFVETPEEFFRLVERCKQLSERTHGFFDITLGPIYKKWNFDQLKPVIADPKEAEALLPLVGSDKIELDPVKLGVRLTKDDMELDFRAVIRAYALERSREILKAGGFSDYIMFIGGDAIVSGTNFGSPWQIVLQHPRKTWNYFGKMTFDQPSAMISQADFRHFFISKGFRYHDLIDPKTAAPVQRVRVATAVMDDLVAAAALTYAVHVQGHEAGLKLAEEWNGVPLLVQDVWNHNHWNEAMKKYFVEEEGKNMDLKDPKTQKQ